MKFQEVKLILKRLYRDYVKKHIKTILIALILSIIVAGSTSGIAWLLDPAVKKIFVEKDFSVLDIFQSKAFWSLSKNLEAFKDHDLNNIDETRKEMEKYFEKMAGVSVNIDDLNSDSAKDNVIKGPWIYPGSDTIN